MRFLLVYKSTVLAIFLTLLVIYLFFVAPAPESNGRIIARDDTGETLVFAPGARPSPIHSRFGVGTSTISAPLDGRRVVRVVTTTQAVQESLATATVTNLPKPEVVSQPTPQPDTPPVNEPEPVEESNTTLDPTVTPQPEPTPEIIPQSDYQALKWGVFTGSNPAAVADFETRVSENPDYLAYFVHWGNGGGALPDWLSGVAAEKGRTLVLFWEASDYLIGGTNQPAYSYERILAGDWDEYFNDFAKQIAAYPGPMILIPFSELNGNWTPWSGTKNGNTPQKAVEAWRYVHDFVGNIPNVQIGWAVNAASVPNTPENQIENYYPGNAFVDIVGVDGFNDGPPWYTFEEIFNPPLTKLSRYGKPVFLFSFASAEGPNKADWMRDAFFEQMPKYPRLEAWIWFNQNKERNWLLWSDNNAFAVFEDAIKK